MKRSCIVITWDSAREVVGIRAEKNGRTGQITVVATAGPATEGEFPQRLSTVYSQLVTGEHDYVLLGGTLPGEICFDLKMPRIAVAAIPAALAYELPCLIPKGIEDYHQSFRLVNRLEAQAKENHLRICLTPVKEWERLVGDIDAAGINADAVVNPLLAVDPLLAGQDIYFIDHDEEYAFRCQAADGLRQMTVVTSDHHLEAFKLKDLKIESPEIALGERYLAGALLVRYAFDGYLTLDRKTLLRLPSQLQPQRCVAWRKLAVALGIVTFILLLLLAGRNWNDARARYAKVTAAEAKVNAILLKQQRLMQKNITIEKAIQKIGEAKTGNPEVPAILSHLTKKLPDKMWVTSFQCRGQAIDLSITTSEDNDNILTLLSENGICIAKNLRKNRNLDGTSTLQLFLETPGNSNSGEIKQ